MLNMSEVDGRTGNQGGQPGTSNVLNMSEVDGRMGILVADWGDWMKDKCTEHKHGGMGDQENNERPQTH